MVWLTGAALVIGLLMIVGLLLLVLVNGLKSFWPAEIIRVETLAGQSYLGEVTREQEYVPSETQVAEFIDRVVAMHRDRIRAAGVEPDPDEIAALAAAARSRVESALAVEGGMATRRLLRTENYDLTQSHFHWISDFEIERETRPGDAVLLERREYGRFYGFPAALLVDGETVATGPEEIWERFEPIHRASVQRFEARKSLEADDLGALSNRGEQAELEMLEVRLDLQREMRSPSPDRERVERIRREHQAAVEGLEALEAENAAARRPILAKIEELNRENDRYALLMRTAAGEELAIPVWQIVREVRANQLGFFGKLGVYFSRWAEFLLDDPREANTEGGVWPAIAGTVLMTLIMVILVVPFGVLAALYLREYAKAGLVVSTVRIAINNLAGVPSIVFGVFGLGFFCYFVGGWIDTGPANPVSPGTFWLGFSGLVVLVLAAVLLAVRRAGSADRGSPRKLARFALPSLWIGALSLFLFLLFWSPFFDGFFAAKMEFKANPTFGKSGMIWASLTLALLTLPVVIVATEEALAAVPSSMREGSYACGASKWQTIRNIVLPRAMPGIMTGTILAMARGAGEVAPLMLVGAVKMADKLPWDVNAIAPYFHVERSFMHLGFHIYDLGFQSQNSEAAKPMVFTTTLLLIGIVVTLNVAAVYIRSRLRRKFEADHF